MLTEVFTGHPVEKKKISPFILRHWSGAHVLPPCLRGLQRALQAVADLADILKKRSALWTAFGLS